MVCTHPLVIHLAAFSLRFLPGRLGFGSLLLFFPLRVLYMLNCLLRQTAEHVYQLGSYLLFLSQLASVPLGVLFAWEHKGSPGARPQTLNRVYVFECDSATSICCQESRSVTLGLLLPQSFCLVFIPFHRWDTNSQLLTPDTSSWLRKTKKNKANPKAQL